MVGLTSLLTRNPPMLPKLNRRRALLVLTKIDEILAWEKQSRNGEGHPLRRTREVPLRSAGGAVLATGKPEVV